MNSACEETTGRAAELLIVDDDDGVRTALGDLLDYEGYPVTLCSNGKEAMDHLRSQPLPFLILLDLQMPEMDGWQFCRERKKDAALSAVPVIVITAFQSPGELGVNEIIHKPIDVEHLLNSVRSYYH